MIYTDKVHLVSDTSYNELHDFAKKVGLKKTWFQDVPKVKYPHYDVTTKRKLRKVLDAGAKLVLPREIITMLRELNRRK